MKNKQLSLIKYKRVLPNKTVCRNRVTNGVVALKCAKIIFNQEREK
jgi:hypothetical protein